MPSDFSISILSAPDVAALLADIEGIPASPILRTGMNKALAIFRRAGQANLTQRYKGYQTGTLHASFRTVVRTRRGAWVGFNRTAAFGPSGRHAHLVDRGTKPRTTRRGLSRGQMPANLFWTDARHTQHDAAIQALADSIRQAAQRLADRWN